MEYNDYHLSSQSNLDILGTSQHISSLNYLQLTLQNNQVRIFLY